MNIDQESTNTNNQYKFVEDTALLQPRTNG